MISHERLKSMLILKLMRKKYEIEKNLISILLLMRDNLMRIINEVVKFAFILQDPFIYKLFF